MNTAVYTEIRLLLTLWNLGEGKGLVKRSVLLRSTCKGKEKATIHNDFLLKLQEDGAIAITEEKVVKVSLTDAGLQRLAAGMLAADFVFEGQLVGSRLANAGLKWFRENHGLVVDEIVVTENASEATLKISTYDEFKAVALETYDQLNRDYNLSNLVPIYQIRREIGDRVTRSQFNDWMLELQSKDILQFITGGVADLTPDKEKDSITTELGGLRYYAKLL
ncbi:MAG: hypothetical protein WCP16_19400 [Pseudanabaena sp. ELA645]|jgi:hypothetical protein